MKLKDVMPTLLVDGAIFKYLTLLTSETEFTVHTRLYRAKQTEHGYYR